MKKVDLYTDGACKGNPGPGGYGIVLCHEKAQKEMSGGFLYTTNNRMELLAAILGLEALNQSCEVALYSDSKYLIDALNKGWLKNWQRRGYIKRDGQPVKNPDLWERLAKQLARHRVTPIWVKGHASNNLNNRCDKLAVAAAANAVEKDLGYRP